MVLIKANDLETKDHHRFLTNVCNVQRQRLLVVKRVGASRQKKKGNGGPIV